MWPWPRPPSSPHEASQGRVGSPAARTRGLHLQLLHTGFSRGLKRKACVSLRKNMATDLKCSQACCSEAAVFYEKNTPAVSCSFDPCLNGRLKTSFAWRGATDTVFDLGRDLANRMTLNYKSL